MRLRGTWFLLYDHQPFATSTAVKTGAPSGVPVLHRSRGLVMVGKKTVHILRNYDRQSKAGPRGLIRTARHTGRANRK